MGSLADTIRSNFRTVERMARQKAKSAEVAREVKNRHGMYCNFDQCCYLVFFTVSSHTLKPNPNCPKDISTT